MNKSNVKITFLIQSFEKRAIKPKVDTIQTNPLQYTVKIINKTDEFVRRLYRS